MISNGEMRLEMKSRGNRRLIKMKLCNNTRIIHHHPSCICLQETDYMDLNWNIILPSFELFMGLLTRFIPPRKTWTHYVMQECVCVYLWAFSHILFKCRVRIWSYVAIRRISKGLSLIQFTWDPLARAELSIGLPLLMRSGGKIESGGLAVIR